MNLRSAARRPPAIAAWAQLIDGARPETARERWLARFGGIASVTALVCYLTWRIAATMPSDGANRRVAWLLIAFEALPLLGLLLKLVTLWTVDAERPVPVPDDWDERRVVLLIPTYNEPLEVIAPTIAAACQLAPRHETWVLDDGDRPWVQAFAEACRARYVCRPVHDHAKAGNLNYALGLMAAEADDAGSVDVIAVLDCDHVPLPSFLTSTLGWFDDDRVALVQGPHSFYNAGAFDDDGYTGEQGLFFNVLMPSRHHAEAGPFWCGSTSLLRVSALQEVGGVATETITEDMHTTLKLIRRGWRTVYHHQTLAVGLAPSTPEQYLVQRRRWGMGAMQIMVHERLWAAKRWMSWRNYHEYLNGTLWWLEGVASILAFAVPIALLVSGANTSTAPPVTFTLAFVTMFLTRLWGAKRLLRGNIRWSTAFALRVFRVPVGLACAWWLVTRRDLRFAVTPKGGANERSRGHTPRVIWALIAASTATLVYAALGVVGIVPWRTTTPSTVASGAWLVLGLGVLAHGTRRVRAADFATSRRNAHRMPVGSTIGIDGEAVTLLDVSVGGMGVRCRPGLLSDMGFATVDLPGGEVVKLEMVRLTHHDGFDTASLRVTVGDWRAYRALSLWIFHTPAGAVPELPPDVPVAALTAPLAG